LKKRRKKAVSVSVCATTSIGLTVRGRTSLI
jgi:hypothetical protein